MELASVRDVSYTRLVLLKCGASGVEHVATPHIHPPFQDSSEVVLLNGSNEHIITKQALGAHFAPQDKGPEASYQRMIPVVLLSPRN